MWNFKYEVYFLRTDEANNHLINNGNQMFPEFDETDTIDWILVEGEDDSLKNFFYF